MDETRSADHRPESAPHDATPPKTTRITESPATGQPPGESREYPDVPGYELLGVLGHGGMGVVYRARQLKANRIVALKMIRAVEHASPTERLRFQIETEAVARLQHPNIVQLHEVGEVHGQPYFSLEFCDGGSLTEQLKKKRPSPHEAAELIVTLARAMHYAHLRGVVHRDLKPGNVLLMADGTPKITDFGLAKRIDDEARDVSKSGSIMGTASYMAPEQAAGNTHDTGPATDVHALGSILYECLTGEPPFKADTYLDTILQVMSDEPVSPRQRQSKAPRDLEAICMKCLQKEPRRRYASAEQLADELERYLKHKPLKYTRPVGGAEKLWLWCRRNPVVAGLLVYAGLLLVAVTVGSVGLARVQGQQLEEELCRSNEFAAAHAASTIQRRLERMGEAVNAMTRDPDLLQLWRRYEQNGRQETDRAPLQAYFDKKRDSYNNDPDRGFARPGGTGPFASLTLLDREGRFKAYSPSNLIVTDKDYSGRDYFRGAKRLADAPGDQMYVSRAFRSEINHRYKLAISVPFRPDDRFAGVVSATVTTDANFGLVGLNDKRHKLVLLAVEDPNPPRGPAPSPEPARAYLILLHPCYAYGDEPLRFPANRVPQFGAHDPEGAAPHAVESDYQDPAGERDPAYAGRMLAGFAPVGDTGLIVIIQQRDDEAVAPYQRFLWQLPWWALGIVAVGVVLGWLLRRARPPSLLGRPHGH